MFFEEPVPPDSLDSLRAVKDKAPVPIAAGERLYVGTTAACLTE